MSKYILNADLKSPVHSNFVGNAAVYHGYAGMADNANRVYTDEQCELEADRAAEIGLKIARTMYKWYGEYDRETGVWNFDTPNMNAFTRWCQRLYKRGIDIAIQAGWCNPGDINATSWNSGCPYGVEGDFEASLDNYTHWMIQSLKYLVFEKGLTNIKYIVMFTEPQHPAGTMPENYDSCYDTWCVAVERLHNHLVRENMRHLFKLVGPNEGSTVSSVMVKSVAERVKDFIDIYSSHNYLSSWADEASGIKKGESNVTFNIAGGRVQQNVILKPHTDYEVKILVKAFARNDKYVSGNIVFGAFEPENPNDRFNFFTAGGDPTTRLNKNSTKMLDVIFLETDWTEHSHSFNTGDAEEVCIGVFCDIKQNEMGAYLKSVSLTEKDDNKNLLNNSDFSDTNLIFRTDTPFEVAKRGWLLQAAGICSSNAYYDWQQWVKTALQYLPKGKDFWFDEYNINGIDYDNHSTPLFGTRLATAMLALMTSGAQSSVMWTLFDQQWPNNHANGRDAFHDGEHRWGVMPSFFRSYTPYPAYYSAGLMFRYMGGSEGTKIYSAEGGDPIFGCITASPKGKVGIAVINTFDGEREFELNLSHSLGGIKLQKRLYNPATIIPNEDAKQLSPIGEFSVDNKLSDTLPPYGVAVYSNID